MRRLLAPIITLSVVLALAAPALASNRVPTGVKRISVTLIFPPQISSGHKDVRRTITKTASVQKVVSSLDQLKAASIHGICPMYVRLGPQLTVDLRSSSGRILAQTHVLVALGKNGSSGSSFCFPITFQAGRNGARLIGNSYVRLIGQLIGTPIS